MKDFDDYIGKNDLEKTPFAGVSKEDLKKFREYLSFDSIIRNGRCYKTGMSSAYYGDLVAKYFWDDDRVFKAMALFGIGDGLNKAMYHYFGSMSECCRSRPYFNCPYDAVCFDDTIETKEAIHRCGTITAHSTDIDHAISWDKLT